ncbi:hypothetical protein H6F89_01885 [Cyanobacteria bacterium FACHB-63]|nr:hypothetical protein [Cyanobacteria bacterium FACHB-63]
MTTYRLSPRFFSQYRQRMSLSIGVPIFGVLAYNTANSFNRYPPIVTIISTIFVFLIVAISSQVILRGDFRKHQQTWSSYELMLNEDSITRIQDGLERAQISRSEVTKIIEVTGYGLTIASANDTQIFVPRLLENYDSLRTSLLEWRSIDVQNLWRNLALCLSLTFLPWAILYGIARIFQNKFLTAGGLAVYLAYVIFSMAILLKSKNVSRDQKRTFLFGLSIFSIIVIRVIAMLVS